MDSDSSYEPSDLRQCLSRFGLDARQLSIRPLVGGVDNLNLLLDGPDGRLALRRYDITPPSEVAFEVEVLIHLSASGFPTPRLRPRSDGGYLAPFGARPAAIFEYVEGRHAQPDLLDDALAVARLLAQLHLLTRDFRPQCRRSRTDQGRLDALRAAAGKIHPANPKLSSFLEETGRLTVRIGLATEGGAAIPGGVVHHDPNPGNILFSDDGALVALLDFDESHVAPLVTDLASLLHYWAHADTPPGIDVPLARRLIGAYHACRPLAGAERDALGDHVRLFYAADAADFMTRWLVDHPQDRLDIEDCISFRSYRALCSASGWDREIVAGLVP